MRLPVALFGGLLGLAAILSGCSSVPTDRYGVTRLELEGTEAMDSEALASCLSTYERPRVMIQFGRLGRPHCDVPPFEGHPPRLRLWRWPWTKWPLFDELVLEQDLQRIVRWYRARGHYDARIVETRIEPDAAAQSDIVTATTDCRRPAPGHGCRVTITVVIDEGAPVLVREISITGGDELPAELQARAREALQLHPGDRFDEALYDTSRDDIRDMLLGRSYCRAAVDGEVQVDVEAHSADVRVDVSAGPPCVFGTVRVVGNGDLPLEPIVEAVGDLDGRPYNRATLSESQNAVFGLGAFASVSVRPEIPATGDTVDVRVEVTPAQRSRVQVGLGLESGVSQPDGTDIAEQVPQWDLHLSANWEHRNLFGGMRRLRLEERPQLIFDDAFPRVDQPEPGNTLQLKFSQPAFLEPRTTLDFDVSWDLGQDPYLDVYRHQIDVGVTAHRSFLERRLYLSLGLQESVYVVAESNPPDDVSDSNLFYVEQIVRLDMRDDRLRVTSGYYISLGLQEAGYAIPSDWSYIRVAPDVRGYLPLWGGLVLAARASLGALILTRSSPSLDEDSRRIGPTNERFRGGGTTSNRGFAPGELGDGSIGGNRRWLLAAELRIPITRNLFFVPFVDTGDVSSGHYRFDYPQLSTGAGLRVTTPIGPIRLDMGWRVPGVQVLAATDDRSPGGNLTLIDLGFVEFPGAINLIIGDSF